MLKHYDLVILGDDPSARLLVNRVAREFPRILWAGTATDPLSVPGVDVVGGTYRFLSERTVVVEQGGCEVIVSADRFLLACGVVSRRPGWVIDDPRVLLADQFENAYEQLPAHCQTVAVVGLGSTGVDIIRRLQGRVKRIQAFEAGEIHWQAQSVILSGGTLCSFASENAVIGLEKQDHKVRLYLEDGSSTDVDAIIVCCGYQGQTATCDLPAAGLSADDSGRLWCNANYETWTPHIYAAGRVVGFPRGEHTADQQLEILLNSFRDQARHKLAC